MAEKIEELLQGYRHGQISRREFIQRAVALTGSVAAATSLLDSMVPSPAAAAQVAANDPALVSGPVQFPGPAGTVFGYQSRPKGAGKYPGIIVVHENKGVSDHIQDVTRRFAKEGYVALAVDYLSRQGGTAKVAGPDGVVDNIRALVTGEVIKGDTEAALAYLKKLPEVQADRIGITGFCWGGQTTFQAATSVRGLRAVVVFYGRSPNPLDLMQQIEAPVLAHYGELDREITAAVPQTVEAMKKYNKSFEYKIYPGAKHAFHNETNADRYNPEAAKEAWQRTLDFFKKHLKS